MDHEIRPTAWDVLVDGRRVGHVSYGDGEHGPHYTAWAAGGTDGGWVRDLYSQADAFEWVLTTVARAEAAR